MSVAVLILLIIIAGFAVSGYRAGVTRRLAEIVGLVATIIIASRLASSVAPALAERTGLEEEPALWAAWVALVLAGIVATYLLARGVSRVVRLTILGSVDRWGGALCGAAIGTLLVSIVLVAASQVPGGAAIQATLEKSAVGRLVFHAAPTIYVEGRRLLGKEGDELWERVSRAAREKADAVAEQASKLAEDLADGDGD